MRRVQLSFISLIFVFLSIVVIVFHSPIVSDSAPMLNKSSNSIPNICGDANADKSVNIADGVFLIGFIFKGGPAPYVDCIGDANCDSAVNVGDVVTLINYTFRDGISPEESCCP